MKKMPTILVALLLSISMAIGQTPLISMTTSKAIGSTFTVYLQAINYNTPIQVDFGDGNLVNRMVGNFITYISGTLVGSQTVKIYATGITQLDCTNKQITALTVNQNTDIIEFYCGNNLLTNLDISNSQAIKWFVCSHNKLTTLDVSKNSTLGYIDCSYNQLSTLDLTKNGLLFALNCSDNNLNSLDVTMNTILNGLDCSNNYFMFTTLPWQHVWTLFTYAPQKPIPIIKDISTGDALDLSNQLIINGSTTVYKWKTKGDLTLVQDSDYSITDGKTVFLKSPTDSVYCEMTNASFPDFIGSKALKTTNIKVEGQEIAVVTMTTNLKIGTTITLSVGASVDYTQINIDYGDGTLVSKTLRTFEIFANGTLVGSQTVKIYGHRINSITCERDQITTLDVSKNTDLNSLNCQENLLTTLDVTKNVALDHLTCGGNFFTILDISKNSVLSYLDFIGSQLTSIDLTNNWALKLLFSDNNQLSSLDISKNTTLTGLSCTNNQLTSLDISKNTELKQLYCTNNRLVSLDITQNIKLEALMCEHNNFTFATLPLKPPHWMELYYYAPQAQVSIVKELATGMELDLSDQLMVNGFTTVYIWKTKSGTILLQGNDYSVTNGKTVFLKVPTDSVYCEMTNTSFPDLVLKTTNLKVTLGAGTSITNLQLKKPEIYVNDHTLYINLSCNANLLVFDVMGRSVICKPMVIGLNNMHLQHSGIYLIKVIEDKEFVTKKVVVE